MGTQLDAAQSNKGGEKHCRAELIMSCLLPKLPSTGQPHNKKAADEACLGNTGSGISSAIYLH